MLHASKIEVHASIEKQPIRVNFATKEELKKIPGIGPKLASFIISLRENRGNLDSNLLEVVLRKPFDESTKTWLDFTPNIDLNEGFVEDGEETDSDGENPDKPDIFYDSKVENMADEGKPVTTKSIKQEWQDLQEVLQVASTLVKRHAGEACDSLSMEKSGDGCIRPCPKVKKEKTPKSSGESSDEHEFSVSAKKSQRSSQKRTANFIRHLPKGLVYDGKGNWLAFKQKFTRYAKASDWTSAECLDSLCWCLVGKAADYHAILMERHEDLSFRKLMEKLELRFGIRELSETAQVRFQQLSQNDGESLDDWADRVLTLATRAFKDLPEQFSDKQAIVKFCEGLTDKEAGLSVSMRRPSSMEQAINKVRWFQHVNKAVYGKKRQSGKTQSDEKAGVSAVFVNTQEGQANAGPSELSSLEVAIEKLATSFEEMVTKMD